MFAALACARAGGAAGGLVGGLVDAGIPEIEAKRYAGRIREGGYLVSVHCDDSACAKRAEEILEATGGRDVLKTHEATAGLSALNAAGRGSSTAGLFLIYHQMRTQTGGGCNRRQP